MTAVEAITCELCGSDSVGPGGCSNCGNRFDFTTVADALEAETFSDAEIVEMKAWLDDMHAEASRVLGEIDVARRSVAEMIRERFGDGEHSVDGLGVVKVGTSRYRRTWQHTDLLRDLLAAAADRRLPDKLTGSIQTAEAAQLAALIDCASWGAWKVRGTRKYGIDVDEYCETIETPSVSVIRVGGF